jgi:hypothetical protein
VQVNESKGTTPQQIPQDEGSKPANDTSAPLSKPEGYKPDNDLSARFLRDGPHSVLPPSESSAHYSVLPPSESSAHYSVLPQSEPGASLEREKVTERVLVASPAIEPSGNSRIGLTIDDEDDADESKSIGKENCGTSEEGGEVSEEDEVPTIVDPVRSGRDIGELDDDVAVIQSCTAKNTNHQANPELEFDNTQVTWSQSQVSGGMTEEDIQVCENTDDDFDRVVYDAVSQVASGQDSRDEQSGGTDQLTNAMMAGDAVADEYPSDTDGSDLDHRESFATQDLFGATAAMQNKKVSQQELKSVARVAYNPVTAKANLKSNKTSTATDLSNLNLDLSLHFLGPEGSFI